MRSTPLGDKTPHGRAAAAGWMLAAATYLVAALIALRVVAPSPRTILPYAAHLEGASLAIDETDQQFVVASVATMARRVLTDPTRLLESGQCYPMARPVTLGEHMIGEGVLGALPQALWGEPILTYNVVLLLGLWIPGLTMYALVRGLTGSSSAAWVAGFVFAFQAGRIGDPVHPFVHGDLWSPLALLGAHRLLARGRWRDAALLGAGLALQLLESLYTLLALAIVGGVTGAALLVQHRRRLGRALPKLGAVALPIAALAAAIFAPYLETRDTWGVLEGRGGLLFRAADFVPGAYYFPGAVLSLLAVAGVVDRLRARRPGPLGYDPRLAFVVAGGMVFWTVIWGIRVPGTDILIPSPYTWAAERIPGLRAVRAVPAVRSGFYLACAVLAGYGLVALGGRWRPRRRAALAAALTAAAAVEVFVPAVNAVVDGTGQVRLAPRYLAPFPGVRRLGATFPAGAVLDLPFRLDAHSRLTDMAHFIFRGAYHERPVAACYNSFTVPILDDVAAIAGRVPAREALAELRALGFATLQVHDELLAEDDAAALGAALAAAGRGADVRVRPIGRAGAHHAWAIEGTPAVTDRPAALEPLGAAVPRVRADSDYDPPIATVRFRIRNRARATYRAPAPMRPVWVRIRWRPLDGGVAAEERRRLLLPIALAPGAAVERALDLETPAARGRWEVTVTADDGSARRLARVEVVADRREGPAGG